MKLALIVAMSRDRVIGRDNSLPWHLPEDLRHFKAVTMGKAMIMGRKTYDSIGRPLPGRTTLVVTRQPDWSAPGVTPCAGIDEALAAARALLPTLKQEEVMVVGGADIYRQCLPLAAKIYLTRVDVAVAGDVFFPELDAREWRVVAEEAGYSEQANLHYSFVTLVRK